MGNKMLIDATHPEETRVVVLRGSRVEEFDYESASKKQLRGNIYLAKVTRVEPSLQAAFVNYGGNRHGFLAFNEIHPDYYQLPLAERQALKREEEQDSFAEGADHDADFTAPAEGDGEKVEPGHSGASAAHAGDAPLAGPHGHEDDDDFDDEIDPKSQTAALEAALPPTVYAPVSTDDHASDELAFPSESDLDAASGVIEVREEADEDEDGDDEGDGDAGEGGRSRRSRRRRDRSGGNGEHASDVDHVESVGSEDALEELPQRFRHRRRTYKIQEVIKRGQIMLVQVVKEERGNKGAALTTYLSLAGRYTVLMPNTGSGGGISRKISSPADRKRLREIATELDVSKGMGLIVRTAGASRTKTEIKRDYEYLLRLWENVRDLTLKSSAPCLVYEEGDLIKRSIRDLYNREIDEILVAGDDAYRDAKDFMRMLMPSHAKNVQPYKEPEPLFTRYEVERQLNAMFSPQVTLPSGGYIIINQTEALVAVDVNSGKATREYSIEDTALKTNLEAAEEISRQLRLRDLAGLIVVDFIDMEEKRNNRAVERKLKDCLRNDRARIQVGRISPFGLLEMSRQRLRTGMIEGSTSPCQHCQGTGVVRSTESVALSVLRSLEDWLRANPPCNLSAVTSTEVALYILNQKRSYLRDIEARHNVVIGVTASDRIHGANFYIEKVAQAVPTSASAAPAAITQDRIIQPFEAESVEGGDDQGRRSRRRRRRRRGGRGEDQGSRDYAVRMSASDDDLDEIELEPEAADSDMRAEPQIEREREREAGEDNGGQRRRSRRRGRRGGRHQRGRNGEGMSETRAESSPEDFASAHDAGDGPAAEADEAHGMDAAHRPEPKAAERRSAPIIAEAAPAPAPEAKESPALPAEEGHDFRRKEPAPSHVLNGSGKPNGKTHAAPEPVVGGEGAEPDLEEAKAVDVRPSAPPPPPKPRGTRRGWWQKR